jgi:nucleolar MIF4G domain-containing protein 1
MTLVLELYNFQVVSCVLIYDLVNALIGDLEEYNVELLLKIMRSKLYSNFILGLIPAP